MGEIVEHEIAAGLHLAGGEARVTTCAFIGVVAVNVDPVEMVVRKPRQNLLRPPLMDRDAAVLRHGGIEQRHIDIDQMQFGRVAGPQNVQREISAIGADFGDPRLLRQIFHQLMTRRAQAAVRQQLRRNRQRALASFNDVPAEAREMAQRLGDAVTERQG